MKSLSSSTRVVHAGLLGLFALASAACSSSKKSEPPPGATANNWVTMGYDVQSTYHNTRETKLTRDNVGTLVKKWDVPPPNSDPPTLAHYDTAVIVGDTLYAGGTDGIHAFDANTGNQIWVFQEGSAITGITASMSFESDTLYAQTTSGSLMAIDVSTNPPTIKPGVGTDGLWDVPVNPPRGIGYSSAIIAGDLIVTGASLADTPPDPNLGPYRGAVAAFHKSDGSLAWRTPTTDANEDGCSVWGTVAIDPDAKIVYAPIGNNYTIPGSGSDSIQAFNLDTGTLKWLSQVHTADTYCLGCPGGGRDFDFGANPVVFDFNGKKLVAGGSKSGDVFIWDRIQGGLPLQRRTLCGGELLHGGVIQGLSFDGERLILQCNNGKSTAPGSEPANGDDGGSTSAIFALVPDTLDILWERQVGAHIWTPITIANGVGYFGLNTRLEAFNTETGARLFQYQVAGTIGSGITVSNGRIFFGSGMSWILTKTDGKLVSLQLP